MNNKLKKEILPVVLSLSLATSFCSCSFRKNNDKKTNIPSRVETTISENIKTATVDIISENMVVYPVIEENNIEQSIPELKTNEEIAKEVISGLWGNAGDRIERLTLAGYDYIEIQNTVNELMKKYYPNLEYGYVGFINCGSNLRDENGELITEIEEYQKVIIYDEYRTFFINDEYRSYVHITIPNVCDGYVLFDNISYLPDTYVEVDISEQKLYMYKDNENVFEANIISGNSNAGNPTDIGYTEIYDKRYQTVLEKYDCYVDSFFSFNDTEGFHDADGWRSDDEYGDKNYYLINGSHGCINMKQEDIDLLDQYVSVGTKVLVHN